QVGQLPVCTTVVGSPHQVGEVVQVVGVGGAPVFGHVRCGFPPAGLPSRRRPRWSRARSMTTCGCSVTLSREAATWTGEGEFCYRDFTACPRQGEPRGGSAVAPQPYMRRMV